MNCPYCLNESSKNSYLEDTRFNGKVFSYRKCNSCAVLFLDPFPSEDDFLQMYPEEYQGYVFDAPTNKYAELLKTIKKLKPDVTSFVDYGCGNCELICDAYAHGLNTIGVEYNGAFIDKIKAVNPKIAFYSIEEFSDMNDSYDVIVLNNVLEHLVNPNEIIQRIKSKLSAGGLIVCLGPLENNSNLALFCRKTIFSLRKKIVNKTVSHVPYHITFTNYKNQQMFFQKNGFEELVYEIKEVEWPFPEKVEFTSFKGFFFGSIAKISMFLSNNLFRKSGNVFQYIGKNKMN